MNSPTTPSPAISVVIPTFNRQAYLSIALQSVLDQNHRPIELIVVDDGSTDGTLQYLADQKARFAEVGCELRVLQQPHGGAALARNLGVEKAKAEYVAFLDSDDLWRPGMLSELSRLLDKNPSAAIAFCGIEGVDEHGRAFAVRDNGLTGLPGEGLLVRPFERLVHHMPLQTSGVMARRAVLLKVGGFDPALPVVEDWDLWYRLGKQHDFAYTFAPLACNRSHAENLPKTDLRALSAGVRMNLAHLNDIADPAARSCMIARIRKQLTLLQERLLAEGRMLDGVEPMLRVEVAPRTLRYRLGSSLLRWRLHRVGRLYSSIVRSSGEVARTVRFHLLAKA